ncbi:hypothetical protein Acr_22g0005550 [Actinidia rufa]|uniref:Uncharacterized protein n=1 Tax=Actinidia rufa TaxID=165716 RepID=A0A7J0GK17_9ERIC|nr:hypothetical protein Acr_22g0005550 [Actinidia rufa]
MRVEKEHGEEDWKRWWWPRRRRQRKQHLSKPIESFPAASGHGKIRYRSSSAAELLEGQSLPQIHWRIRCCRSATTTNTSPPTRSAASGADPRDLDPSPHRARSSVCSRKTVIASVVWPSSRPLWFSWVLRGSGGSPSCRALQWWRDGGGKVLASFGDGF